MCEIVIMKSANGNGREEKTGSKVGNNRLFNKKAHFIQNSKKNEIPWANKTPSRKSGTRQEFNDRI